MTLPSFWARNVETLLAGPPSELEDEGAMATSHAPADAPASSYQGEVGGGGGNTPGDDTSLTDKASVVDSRTNRGNPRWPSVGRVLPSASLERAGAARRRTERPQTTHDMAERRATMLLFAEVNDIRVY